MTRRKVRKQGCVFPLFSPDSVDRLSLHFHRFVILYISCVVIHEVWALHNNVYRKCPMALTSSMTLGPDNDEPHTKPYGKHERLCDAHSLIMAYITRGK